MSKITLWTRQHLKVLEELEAHGRYTAKKEIVRNNEEVKLMMPAYDWLMRAHPDLKRRPPDADYPIWTSFQRDTVMMDRPDSVLLELEIDSDLVTRLNILKWGAVNNMSYIPADEADRKRHLKLLADLGISDVKACSSRFYPEIKAEIENSWARVFDDRISLGNDYAYGLIWEIRKEWLR